MVSIENRVPEEYNGLPKVESQSVEAVHFPDSCAVKSTSYGLQKGFRWALMKPESATGENNPDV